MSEQSGDNPAAQKIRESALRFLSNPKASGFRKNFLSNTGHVPVVSSSGIYLGTRLAYSFKLSRLFSVVERTVRGLYYHEIGFPLPEDQDVLIMNDETLNYLPIDQLNDCYQNLIKPVSQCSSHIIGNRVFEYRFYSDEVYSVWGLTFYAGINFLAITGPKRLRDA
ncbi:hypothetical protein ES708_08317 [subsurface metagenome]